MSDIVPVVEGDGESEAVPLLLRRILRERYRRYDLDAAKPKVAHGREKLLADLERYLAYSAITPGCRAILVLLDAEKNCAEELALRLAAQARQVGLGKPVAIVCATRQYEAWFLASLDTIKGRPIKGRPGLSNSAAFTGSVEAAGAVKEWLSKRMPPGRAYKETLDQVPMTEYLDLTLAYNGARSFRRLCHAVEELVAAIDTGAVTVTP